jgi:hypothetical protein
MQLENVTRCCYREAAGRLIVALWAGARMLIRLWKPLKDWSLVLGVISTTVGIAVTIFGLDSILDSIRRAREETRRTQPDVNYFRASIPASKLISAQQAKEKFPWGRAIYVTSNVLDEFQKSPSRFDPKVSHAHILVVRNVGGSAATNLELRFQEFTTPSNEVPFDAIREGKTVGKVRDFRWDRLAPGDTVVLLERIQDSPRSMVNPETFLPVFAFALQLTFTSSGEKKSLTPFPKNDESETSVFLE